MLVFLDIDGVMVTAKSWKKPELLSDGFSAFTSKATNVLQKIISDDTTVMLTTSHKSKYTIDEWKRIFEKRGVNIRNLKTLDSNIKNLNRKDEVLNWFDVNDVNEDFVIIDDDKSLNDLPVDLKRYLILTSSLIGLTDQHLAQIKSVLNKSLQVA